VKRMGPKTQQIDQRVGGGTPQDEGDMKEEEEPEVTAKDMLER